MFRWYGFDAAPRAYNLLAIFVYVSLIGILGSLALLFAVFGVAALISG